MKLLKCIVILVIALAHSAAAQTSVTARLDTAKALVGQVVALDIKVVQPQGIEVFWPLLNDSIGGVDLINSGEADTQKTSGDQLLITRRFELMPFDSGNFVIPALVFNVRSPKGNQELATDPLKLEVFYMPVDTTKEIKDIAPLIEVKYDWKNALLIAAGILLIAIAAWFLYKKFKKEKETIIVAPDKLKPSHELALEELEQLRLAGLWQQGRIKEYYTELTDILRRYISTRWNINAMELTSDEILSAGFVKLLGNEDRARLQFILNTADLVKFAKALPIAADHENCMLNAVEFVKASIPQPVIEKPEEEVKA